MGAASGWREGGREGGAGQTEEGVHRVKFAVCRFPSFFCCLRLDTRFVSFVLGVRDQGGRGGKKKGSHKRSFLSRLSVVAICWV